MKAHVPLQPRTMRAQTFTVSRDGQWFWSTVSTPPDKERGPFATEQEARADCDAHPEVWEIKVFVREVEPWR